MGIDGIPPKVLKHCVVTLYEPIYFYFVSCCLQHLPCFYQIIPTPKSRDKTSVTNYRPISLLCIISKLLERIVYDKIIGFISQRISTSEFGFIKKLFHSSAITCFLSDIHNSHDLGLQTDIIYTDFKKGFDTVPHDELLFKLWSIGIGSSLWKWFRAI